MKLFFIFLILIASSNAYALDCYDPMTEGPDPASNLLNIPGIESITGADAMYSSSALAYSQCSDFHAQIGFNTGKWPVGG